MTQAPVRFPLQKPMVVAHRGYSSAAPENTLNAFEIALDAGVDMVELDVQLSKDLEVVVIHDTTVERTTNGKGKVSQLTLQELKCLDAGSWFNGKFEGAKIPTLREALNLITTRAYANIELKTLSLLGGTNYRLIDATAEIVKDMKAFDSVLFSSFSSRIIRSLKKNNPAANVGVIYHPIKHYIKLPSSLAISTGARVFICHKKYITEKFLTDARTNDIIIGVYGIRSETEAKELLDMGIKVLVSDDPGILVKIVKKS